MRRHNGLLLGRASAEGERSQRGREAMGKRSSWHTNATPEVADRFRIGIHRAQVLSRYPVFNSHRAVARQITRKTNVIPALISTLTSETS